MNLLGCRRIALIDICLVKKRISIGTCLLNLRILIGTCLVNLGILIGTCILKSVPLVFKLAAINLLETPVPLVVTKRY